MYLFYLTVNGSKYLTKYLSLSRNMVGYLLALSQSNYLKYWFSIKSLEGCFSKNVCRSLEKFLKRNQDSSKVSNFRSNRPGGFLERGVLKICRIPMSKCDFSKVTLQLYWNHTSTWVFSCKFAAYFQYTFS